MHCKFLCVTTSSSNWDSTNQPHHVRLAIGKLGTLPRLSTATFYSGALNNRAHLQSLLGVRALGICHCCWCVVVITTVAAGAGWEGVVQLHLPLEESDGAVLAGS